MALLKANTGIGITNPSSALHVIGDGLFVGVVSATTFYGNLGGGVQGSVPYQSGISSTTFLSPGTAGQVLVTGGAGQNPYWTSAGALSGSFTGITIRDEGTIVGAAASVSSLNFVGSNILATASGVGATITIADNLVGTALSITGISTLGTVKISSGIVTATSGVVTYYGDGSKLTGIVATTAGYASTAGIATYATNAGIATNLKGGVAGNVPYQSASDTTNFVNNGIAGQVLLFSGSIPYWGSASSASGSFNGITIRDEGTIVGSAASITSIDFVGNNIVATASGAGATITLSNDAQYLTGTAPGNVISQSSGLTVTGNVSISGNLSVGGTSAILNAATLSIKDKDIVLGITTNALNQDVSTDASANHGGIAIASTEGSPLIDIVGGVGTDSIPYTYKQIMWLRSGSWAGLNTDAWLFNYGVGIGSTQLPSGTRLAVGSVKFTENDLSVVRNINASGVITATQFVGPLSGNAATATYATNTGIATNIKGGVAGNVHYQSATDTTSFVTNGTAGQVLLFNGSVPIWGSASAASGSFSGITVLDEGNIVGSAASVSTLNFVGSNIVATASGVAATITIASNLVGTALSITGISTFTNGPVLIGSGTSTGTASQLLQVTGGAYVSGSVGIGTTNPVYPLDVNGNMRLRSGLYDFNNQVGAAGSILISTGAGISWTSSVASSGGISSISISTNTTNQLQYLTYATGTGNTTGLGVTTTGLVFNPSTTRLGIGTTNPTSALTITGGDINLNDGGTYSTAFLTITPTANRFISLPDATGTVALVAGSSGQVTYNSAGIQSGSSAFTFDGSNVALTGRLNVSGITTLGTVQISSGIVTATVGVVTYYGDGSKLTGITASSIVGITTYATSAGIATYATSAGVSTNVIGGIGSITQLQVSGISTFTNGPVFIGAATSTGTASQRLQVTGGAYISGSVGIATTNPIQPFQVGAAGTNVVVIDSMGEIGIGTTNPTQKLHVQGNARITGGLYDSNNNVGAAGSILISTGVGISWTSSVASSGGISSVSISTSTATQSQFLTFVAGTGTTTGFGVSTTGLVFNPSTGNLGIGTTNPLGRLQVGTGTSSVTVTGIGSVGIGVTNPLQKLHVLGNLLVAAGSATNQHITQKAYELNSGTLSWEGTSGQLFSITNNLTSGSIFSVNDISGIPSIDVNADGTISLGAYGGNIGVGITNPLVKLDVRGTSYFRDLVGIGTTTPAFKIDIVGDARVQSTNKMRFGGTAGTTNFYIQYNSTTNSLDFVAG